MIYPTVNHVTLDSFPVREHLVRVVLQERFPILEQHHVLSVQLDSTATLVKPVVWLVLRELFQMPDQIVVNNVQKVPIHHPDQLIAHHAMQVVMPVVRETLSAPSAKLESTPILLEPHPALSVMLVKHPLKDPQSAHSVV